MRKIIGFVLGIVACVVLLLIPPPNGLPIAGWKTAAIAILLGIWWVTEAIPIAVTALVPIVLFPLLNIIPVEEATAPYANPIIFLFMGGFIVAIAMQRWDLHRRIAINILNVVGTKPASIILGFLISSAFLSMWISNTATALMMLPIGLSVLELVDQQTDSTGKSNFEICLVLSIAFGCSIGGMGTLIGTPPNALLAGFVNTNYNIDIGFANWMMVGVPMIIVSLPLAFLLLTKVVFPLDMDELPGGDKFIKDQLDSLGKISNPEKKVAIVASLTALLWIIRPVLVKYVPGLSDTVIAIGAAIVLFFIPVNSSEQQFILKWSDTKDLPWGVLLLFGGGLSLASAITSSGLSTWIGQSVQGLSSLSIVALVAIVLVLMLSLTEMTSNTATAAAFLPILAAVAIGLGQNPFLFIIPAAFAASCAFMLPVATPPNAIVYGSGKITIPQMAKAGVLLDIAFLILILLATFTLISYVFGISLGVVPAWAG